MAENLTGVEGNPRDHRVGPPFGSTTDSGPVASDEQDEISRYALEEETSPTTVRNPLRQSKQPKLHLPAHRHQDNADHEPISTNNADDSKSSSQTLSPQQHQPRRVSAYDQNEIEAEEYRVMGLMLMESHPPPHRTFLQNIVVMFTTFPYWNMAFWSGWTYSVGSALFIVSGCWSIAPLWWPYTEFNGEVEYGVALWFFFGAILYQIGGVMAYLEAINDGSFAGAGMKRLLKGHPDLEKELLDANLRRVWKSCYEPLHLERILPHHRGNAGHESEKPPRFDEERGIGIFNGLSVTESLSSATASTEKKDEHDLTNKTNTARTGNDHSGIVDKIHRRGGVDQGAAEPLPDGRAREYLTWRWWPTWHAFRTYHIYDLGYIAVTVQLFGVTLYGVAAIVVLPGILDDIAWWQQLAAYWVPQVVASCCFLGAGFMFTIMTQEKWYLCNWKSLSWWVGLWAQIGSVGFL